MFLIIIYIFIYLFILQISVYNFFKCFLYYCILHELFICLSFFGNTYRNQIVILVFTQIYLLTVEAFFSLIEPIRLS
jgi:hypothetical protein